MFNIFLLLVRSESIRDDQVLMESSRTFRRMRKLNSKHFTVRKPFQFTFRKHIRQDSTKILQDLDAQRQNINSISKTLMKLYRQKKIKKESLPEKMPKTDHIKERQGVIGGPLLPGPPLFFRPPTPTAVSPSIFIPTFLGLGAGLYWFLSQPTYAQSGSYEGPYTNVTSVITNNNSPNITSSASATGSSSNTNTDNDTLTNIPTNTNTATDGKKKRK